MTKTQGRNIRSFTLMAAVSFSEIEFNDPNRKEAISGNRRRLPNRERDLNAHNAISNSIISSTRDL